MNSDITPSSSSTPHDVDIEALTQSNNHSEKSRTTSCDIVGPRRSTSRSSEHRTTCKVDERGDKDKKEPPHNTPPANVSSPHHGTFMSTDAPTQSEWKPWKADDPLRTWVPVGSQTTVEGWVKEMDASDNGMCKGWRDQIDTLIIFAGLFSATVTAFTVESYQWLNETPADTLARLQLRDRLGATHNPAIDRLAPATFYVSSASVAINTLWFASLTLSLAAVVISILCKQWLYEYQRYDNFTTDETFLIRGLRHRGLQAWRVPEIIAFLPILLQSALVLFLIGILVLLWPLQTVVALSTTILVGLTFLFLVVTTTLPSIQYIFPKFETQCAYKSSQSWSFFLISAFCWFDFSEFTSWASFDRWEVTCVYGGTGHTLSRIYKLLWNSADAVQSICSILAHKSLKPTINADLTLLPDFVEGLDASQQQLMGVSSPTDLKFEGSQSLRRVEQLKGCLTPPAYRQRQRLKPDTKNYHRFSSGRIYFILNTIGYAYRSATHRMMSEFLRSKNHTSHPVLFNRYIEHWARGLDIGYHIREGRPVAPPSAIYSADIPYQIDTAKYLVELHTYLFKTDQIMAENTVLLLGKAYLNLMESHHQYKRYPQYEHSASPATLLQDMQEWVNRVPDSDLHKKAFYAEGLMRGLSITDLGRFSESHTSDLEKQCLISFARFFVALYKREDYLRVGRENESSHIEGALAFFREYLDQNLVTSP